MTQSDRTYRVHTVLAKLDGPYRDAIILRPPMTPVVSNGKTIGFAHIYPESDYLMADIALDYATEERLIIETRSNKLYARLNAELDFGGIYDYDFDILSALVRFDVLPQVVQLNVKQLVLYQSPAYKDQVALGFVA